MGIWLPCWACAIVGLVLFQFLCRPVLWLAVIILIICLLEILNEVLCAQGLAHSRYSKKSRSFFPLMIEFLEVGNPVLFISLVPTPCGTRPTTKGIQLMSDKCLCA